MTDLWGHDDPAPPPSRQPRHTREPREAPRTPVDCAAPYDRASDIARNLAASEASRVARCEQWGVDPSAPDHEAQIRAARDLYRCDPRTIERANREIAQAKREYAARHGRAPVVESPDPW